MLEVRDVVVGAAELERPGALEHFRFHERRNANGVAQSLKWQQWRADGDALQQRRGTLEIGGGYEVC